MSDKAGCFYSCLNCPCRKRRYRHSSSCASRPFSWFFRISFFGSHWRSNRSLLGQLQRVCLFVSSGSTLRNAGQNLHPLYFFARFFNTSSKTACGAFCVFLLRCFLRCHVTRCEISTGQLYHDQPFSHRRQQ